MGSSQVATVRDVIRNLVRAFETQPGKDFCAEFKSPDSSAAWVQIVSDQINFYYPFKTNPDDQLRTLPIPPRPAMRCVEWEANTNATLESNDLRDVVWLSQFVDGLFTTLYALGPDYKLETDIIEL
jgi:hypothetical protein